ncbi:hypothetical protein OO013_16655 [Mangrovivirga sp. M17]|uniref:Uncharacterized protein n=1 Tax=Mangrovivirga halotolerans TaxID=2993936 RepID=A0ABT3RVZ4_9BACT|nr:hypothetical protein [Mangrovivirga halotolerans]MCX2745513.1 hypothetical protein [Mangrovivirga halotolerans]
MSIKVKYNFFFIWSILFLIIVLIGFIPSFLLRPLFKDTSIPIYLTIHGVIMIAWFIGYFHQNLLIARGKVVNHMKNGIFWFVLAIIMLLTNFNVVIEISSEVIEVKKSYSEKIRTFENSGMLAIGNLYLTLCSSIFILIGYLKRKQTDIHKRALFIACIYLLVPAFDRFMRPFSLEDISPALNFLVLMHLVPLSLIIYDIKKYRKPKIISIGGLIFLALSIPIISLIIKYDFHKDLIKFLG